MLFLLPLLFILRPTFVTAYPEHEYDGQTPLKVPASKRIAVVGAGAAGIGTLKAFMDLDEETRRGWEVVAFEERAGVGGLWRPDTKPVPSPPEIPETPLYYKLQTNGPHPLLTLPNTTFRPETELMAPHEKVLLYHEDMVRDFNLSPYIRLEHSVLEAKWVGSATQGFWDISVEDRRRGEVFHQSFDHLIVATGGNHFPRDTHITGEEEWFSANRTMIHSMYYRRSAAFTGQNVVVVGAGPSGWDITMRIVDFTNMTYWARDSRKENPDAQELPVPTGANARSRIVRIYGNGTVQFRDGSEAHNIQSIILATGFEHHVPFLTAAGLLDEVEDHTNATRRLATNSRYVRPLYEHTLSLDPAYPLGALYFNGLLSINPTSMCNYAQGLFAAYTIARPELLESREDLYEALLRREQCVRQDGYDPLHVGHRPVGYEKTCEYTRFEDNMMDYLKRHGLAGHPGVPPLGVNYTEPWRAWTYRNGFDLLLAWRQGVQPLGDEFVRQWIEGRKTEEDWFDMMQELVAWWDEHKPKPLRGLFESATGIYVEERD